LAFRGNVTRAAEELNVTHGAVSRQIRLLDNWLGTRLFARTSRNAVPTGAGTSEIPTAGHEVRNPSAAA